MLAAWLYNAPAAFAQTGVHCGDDLIKIHGLRIPHLEFVPGAAEKPGGQRMCESVYRVPGKHAKQVEALLVRKYGMAPLVFECCGWFPKRGQNGSFKRSHPLADGAIADYEIGMSSEETTERRWVHIGYFYVRLTIYSV